MARYNQSDKPILFMSAYMCTCNYTWIQVEHFTVSVVVFIVMVELIALRGKMTGVARRE